MLLESLAATSAVKKGASSPGSAGLVGLLSLGFLEKVPQGFVAVRVHNGNYTRSQDSLIVPEWKQDTFIGYYGRGLRAKIPWLQHFELVDIRDRVSHLSQQIKSKNNGPVSPRTTNHVASTIVWGIPAPEKIAELTEKGEVDVSYETILLRALTKASQGSNSVHTLQEAVEGVFRSGMRTIIGDYDDPADAQETDVYHDLQELKSAELFEYGVELRKLYLTETAPVGEQIIHEGLIRSPAARIGAATLGTWGPEGVSQNGHTNGNGAHVFELPSIGTLANGTHP